MDHDTPTASLVTDVLDNTSVLIEPPLDDSSIIVKPISAAVVLPPVTAPGKPNCKLKFSVTGDVDTSFNIRDTDTSLTPATYTCHAPDAVT